MEQITMLDKRTNFAADLTCDKMLTRTLVNHKQRQIASVRLQKYSIILY